MARLHIYTNNFIFQVRGDGSCLFESILKQLAVAEHEEFTQRDMRQNAVAIALVEFMVCVQE